MRNSTARDLFPDIFLAAGVKDEPVKKEKSSANIIQFRRTHARKKHFHSNVLPPSAPDVGWLREGRLFVDERLEEERNRVLIVCSGVERTALIKSKIESLKFQAELADTPEKAIEIIRSGVVSVVFVDFSLEFRSVHKYVCWLPPDNRRNIVYVLVGDNFHTLYDLEAFSHSANLVINNKDLPYLDKIFIKGIHDYEKLFSPILEVLRIKR